MNLIKDGFKKLTKKDYKRWIWSYDDRFNFSKYKNDKIYNRLSFASKFNYLKEFHNKLDKIK